MAKGKAKFSSESVAAPQPRSLRSRKRECPSEELSVDAEAPLHQQDSKGNNTAVVRTHVQSLESPLQECATITSHLLQAAEQSCPTKHDAFTEEKQAENKMEAPDELKENPATCPNQDPQPQGCIINLENGVGKKEIQPEKVTVLVSDTLTDHQQVLTAEDADGFCVDALEKQLDAKTTSYCNLESRHESSQDKPSQVCVDDFRDVALGLPVRKKRRMGMCGLTEKERSYFLQTQKRENGHSEVEVEKQLCNNAVDPVAQDDTVTPAPSAEIQLQSSLCGGDTRTETEVTTLDGTGALVHSDGSEGKTSEAEESTVTEQQSNQGAEKTVGSPSMSLKEQEQEEAIPVKQREDGEEDSARFDRIPFTTNYTKTSQNEETEKKNNGSETDSLLCALYVEPAAGSSTVNTEHNETGDTMEPFGSQHFDDVSDSQLNSIALMEEKRMGKEEDAGFSSCPQDTTNHKDATNLVCGLIRELSSLNRKVMAAHRELENLRRGSSRSSTH
ncbi:uncharacterized protein LOC114856953 isoform X2 [Betta splendens]|uniref:Uncharacterized protein LOC114856953 isoform X2 n=1 Tax=Betta splendens TaxID=158456 RepID=A0A6P7MPG2_BETSP|nr:uncharacterized protein LOC114856953 isoform X2 [Betta splendens]